LIGQKPSIPEVVKAHKLSFVEEKITRVLIRDVRMERHEPSGEDGRASRAQLKQETKFTWQVHARGACQQRTEVLTAFARLGVQIAVLGD